jgi:hypothetical protein
LAGSFPLEGNYRLVWAFDFIFGFEKFFTPWFAHALGALVDHIANSKTVIAGPLGAGAREPLASLAGLEKLAFEGPVLAPQFAFTDDAHALLLPTQLTIGPGELSRSDLERGSIVMKRK